MNKSHSYKGNEFLFKKYKGNLNKYNGVDVGPKHKHGGISRGAIGLMLFSQKKRKNYKQLTKSIYI